MRKVRLASLGVPLAHHETLEHKWRSVEPGLALAAERRPDLLVLPEALNLYRRGRRNMCEHCEADALEVPGPEVEMFTTWAADNRAYLVLPLIERHEGLVRNSAILIDRQGRVAARYFKVNPTVIEMEHGVVPGDGPVCFDADFGRLGFAICYDGQFPEPWRGYGEKETRLVCYPSMWSAGRFLNAAALQGNYYILTSFAPQSRLIDPVGRTVATVGDRQTPVHQGYQPNLLVADVDVDYELVHLDEAQRVLKELLAREDVTVDVLGDEDIAMLTTNARELSPLDVLRELRVPTLRETLTAARERRDRCAR